MIKAALLAMAVLVGGCAGGGVGEMRDTAKLGAVVGDTTREEEVRKEADRKWVEMGGKMDPKRLGVLEQVMAAPGNSEEMRIYAIDQIAEADAGRGERDVARELPGMEGKVLVRGCEVLVRLGDKRAAEALVKSMVRGVRSGESGGDMRRRPEWEAMEKLMGKPGEEVLFGMLESGGSSGMKGMELDILQAVMSAEEVMGRVMAMKEDGGWMGDLKKWWGAFGVLPRGANENMWMEFLERKEQEGLLAQAAGRHGRLKGEADYVFAPRFIAVLAYCDEAGVRMTRGELLADLRGRLAGKMHVAREPAYAGAEDDVDERLEANEKKLTRGDLLAMRMVMLALEDAGFAGELQRQGLEDLNDKTSEHGGLLAVEEGLGQAREAPGSRPGGSPSVPAPAGMAHESGKIVPRLYSPMYAVNDFQYVTGEKLLRETVMGVAEYHFHFQEVDNGKRAGPGVGDLRYVRGARCNGVVITSVGKGKMDVDFYTPSGAVVDLGVWEGR